MDDVDSFFRLKFWHVVSTVMSDTGDDVSGLIAYISTHALLYTNPNVSFIDLIQQRFSLAQAEGTFALYYVQPIFDAFRRHELYNLSLDEIKGSQATGAAGAFYIPNRPAQFHFTGMLKDRGDLFDYVRHERLVLAALTFLSLPESVALLKKLLSIELVRFLLMCRQGGMPLFECQIFPDNSVVIPISEPYVAQMVLICIFSSLATLISAVDWGMNMDIHRVALK